MTNFISRYVTQVEVGSLVVEVSGGGLQIYVPDPLSDQLKAGQTLFLHNYLVVREDALAMAISHLRSTRMHAFEERASNIARDNRCTN